MHDSDSHSFSDNESSDESSDDKSSSNRQKELFEFSYPKRTNRLGHDHMGSSSSDDDMLYDPFVKLSSPAYRSYSRDEDHFDRHGMLGMGRFGMKRDMDRMGMGRMGMGEFGMGMGGFGMDMDRMSMGMGRIGKMENDEGFRNLRMNSEQSYSKMIKKQKKKKPTPIEEIIPFYDVDTEETGKATKKFEMYSYF